PSCPPRDPPSFPTRRSSDLGEVLARDVDGAIGARVVDGTVRLQVKGATGVLPDVVTAAERSGFRVTDLSLTEPTLETVFINLTGDRKSTRLNSSHVSISYAV